jgi:hypothetical protein
MGSCCLLRAEIDQEKKKKRKAIYNLSLPGCVEALSEPQSAKTVTSDRQTACPIV